MHLQTGQVGGFDANRVGTLGCRIEDACRQQGSAFDCERRVVGISGASGVAYGVRMLELLGKTEFETHLIISKAGKLNIEIETSYKPGQVEAMADFSYDHKDMAASLASGSFLTEGMVVIPCTIKSLSGIANSYNENLLVRTADVTLKEKRKPTSGFESS